MSSSSGAAPDPSSEAEPEPRAGARTAADTRPGTPADRPERAPTDRDGDRDRPEGSPGTRFRLLAAAALASVLVSYLAMVLVAALAGLTVGAGPAPGALLGAAIPLWLAGHQVPLVIDGAPLGVLPLVPTAGLVALAAYWSARVTRRLGARVREDASAAVATLAGTHASVAVLATALPGTPSPATPWAALLGGGLVTAAGAGAGALWVAGPPAWWSDAPGWLRTGLAAAGVGASAQASAGALMLLAALLAAVGEVHARLALAAPGVGAGIGITLLSVCYLPNAVIAAVGWLAGPGLSIGAASASPLFTSPGPLPQVPLMAAMPITRPPAWTVVAFVLPLLAGALLGRHCRRTVREPIPRLYSVVVAVVVVAVGFALLASVVGGRLGAGQYDPVELPPAAIGAALLVWLGLPAVTVSLLPGRARSVRSGGRGRTVGARGRAGSRRGGRAAEPSDGGVDVE
ncbi:DUF6350 family protein [Pseudonocardia acaciae]|uniref:cell division protein PerM n=1 Tax=Pseudonocardia acaciae TaxID=551276 RepID=UPI0006868612|nr:DUF6350 family protein [Pseudonocardia acaciae]